MMAEEEKEGSSLTRHSLSLSRAFCVCVCVGLLVYVGYEIITFLFRMQKV